MVSFVVVFVALIKPTNILYKFKTKQFLLFSINPFNILLLYYYRLVCKPIKILKNIQEMEKEELRPVQTDQTC